ncbi:MAG: response regulator [Fibrobacterota bacterium]|nr:response regulator [Chitinispirillaceae bacterium]
MKILTIDDSIAVREIIKNALDVIGYESVEAENGVVALKKLHENNGEILLILLDWNMPQMDGITFLRTIKQDPDFKKIPVTMVTSENEKEKIITAISEGAKNYIIKPFTQEELIQKILESLGIA